MNYRRALLLADLHADPHAAVAALARVAPNVERIVVVARVRGFSPSSSTEPPPALDAWRAVASTVAPVELRPAPDLTIDALVDLALTEDIDLLVAGARSFDVTPLLLRTAVRIGVAALWPGGPPEAPPVRRILCAAVGNGAREAIASFLREHGEPALEVAVVGLAPLPENELQAALQVMGIRARVQVLPRTVRLLRSALEGAARGGPIDLVVLARVGTLQLLSYGWPAPVLFVPPAPSTVPAPPRLELTDFVELAGALRARVDEEAPGDAVVALLSDGRVLASAIASGRELEVDAAIDAGWLGAVHVVDDSPPDPLAAVAHRLAILRPQARPLVLVDGERPDVQLRPLRELAAAGALVMVRLRPTRRLAELRQRLQKAGLSGYVVDARTVLDEGDAHDVAESNDSVRLERVAAKLRAAGFAIAAVVHRDDHPAPPVHESSDAIPGNRIEVELDNARARAWLIDAIAASRQSLSLQVYMVNDDEVGRAVEAALVAAGARGVAVRVLVDSLHGLHGSFGAENPLLARLAARPGVELRVWRPLTTFPSLADLKLRDHRKLVVVDQRLALVGGRNIAHEYYTALDEARLSPTTHWRQVPWLDGGARVEGPAVAAIAAAFLAAWTDAGGAPFAVDTPAPAGGSLARVVVHHGLRDARTLEAYLELIEAARSHVYVINGFPLLLELQHALVRAIRRGVRVRALSGHLSPMHDGTAFPGPWSGARNTATEFVHSRLDPIVEAGGEVYLFAQPDPALGRVSMHVHAKVMSADARRCAVGSANFDVTSAYWESELMLVVEDAAVAGELERRVDELCATSTRIDREDAAWRDRARRRVWMRRWPGVLGI